MIEDKIKNEFDSYEIKTTSKMILDKMPQPKPKRKLFSIKYLIPAFATLSISISALIIIISLGINNKSGHKDNNDISGTKNVSLTSNNIASQVALEVLYAGSMNTNTTKSSRLKLMSFKNSSDYTTIINNIDNIYPLFDNLYQGYDGISISYEGGDYKILNTTYDYKYTIGEYILYCNELIVEEDDEIELEAKMALELDGTYYSGKLELEVENEDDESELEVKMTYNVLNDKVTIKREIETEDSETKSSYTYKVEGSSKYEKKVTLENEDGVAKLKYEMKDSNNDIGESIELEEISYGYLIDYSYESDTIDYKADDIILTLNEGNRVYTLDDLVEIRN